MGKKSLVEQLQLKDAENQDLLQDLEKHMEQEQKINKFQNTT
jgi:hypothetical protein